MDHDTIILRGLYRGEAIEESRWEPFRPGIEIIRLYETGPAGPAAALLRYQPGAQLPPHAHTGHEHILVLQGSQRDENGEYGPGDCLINPPGSSHSVSSPNGCVVLAIWASPVKFLEQT